MILGTPAYMSPEQAKGEEVDHQADIWSLGVILYEMLTGQLPFMGEKVESVIYQIINEEPESVTELCGDIPKEIVKIIRKALAKNKQDRYQNLNEMLTDLQSIAETLGIKPAIIQRFSLKQGRKRMTILFSTIFIFVSLILLTFFIFFPTKTETHTTKSIAVLPFENLDKNPESEYYIDGFVEDILTQISKIGKLKVISKMTLKKYKNTDKSPHEIGNELNVSNLLTGSIRLLDKKIRVNCQLIDSNTENQIWAESYDSELKDIFYVQRNVSEKIVQSLKIELLSKEEERIKKLPTANIDAYAYYLKGKELYNLRLKQENEKAIELYKKAIALDPNYALAYTGLANAFIKRNRLYSSSDGGWEDSAMVVCKKALDLDPNLPEAYNCLAHIIWGKGRVNRYISLNIKAFELNPNYAMAIASIGRGYRYIGELAEALSWKKKALSLEPIEPYNYVSIGDNYLLLSDDINAEIYYRKALELQPDYYEAFGGLARMYLRQGEFQKALEQGEKMIDIEPTSPYAHDIVGTSYINLNDYEHAKDVFERLIKIDSSNRDPDVSLGYVYSKQSKATESKKILNTALNRYHKKVKQGTEHPYDFVEMATLKYHLGDIQGAYQLYRKAIDAGYRDYRVDLNTYYFEGIRNEPEFIALIEETKALVDEQKRIVEENDW